MISTLSDISLLSNQGTNKFKKKNKISFDIIKKKKKTRPGQNQIGFILYTICLDLTYVCENTKI